MITIIITMTLATPKTKLFLKILTFMTKSSMLDVARILNTPLVTVILTFVDLHVCKITRNIEKPEKNPRKTPEEFNFRKECL